MLNLVVAEYLYSHPPANPKKENREGWMTKMMGVVSNESLAEIIERRGYDIGPLIPAVIRQQQSYGERVKGGALEAFLGAMYEAYGFEWTRAVILDILSEEIDLFNPDSNFIGNLQEWQQQRDNSVPVYSEIRGRRDGPDHSPTFTCRVDTKDGIFLGEGTGKTVTESRQAAAKMALDRLLKKPE